MVRRVGNTRRWASELERGGQDSGYEEEEGEVRKRMKVGATQHIGN